MLFCLLVHVVMLHRRFDLLFSWLKYCSLKGDMTAQYQKIYKIFKLFNLQLNLYNIDDINILELYYPSLPTSLKSCILYLYMC